VAVFKEKGWTVTGTALTRQRKHLVSLDITKHDEVTKLVSSVQPHVIIHAASERRVDAAARNQERTTALNELATEHLAKLARQHNSFFVYISTDYVFDGKKPPYKPDSTLNPINFYGKSKLAGENAVRRAMIDHYCILRIPLLYGPVESLDESGVTALAELVKMGKPVKIDNWATRFPTYTEDVAYACFQLCQIGLTSKFSGVFHFSGDEGLSKYQQAVLICKLWDVKPDFIVPDDTAPKEVDPNAMRPQNCRMDCSTSKLLGISKVTKMSTGLAKVLELFRPRK